MVSVNQIKKSNSAESIKPLTQQNEILKNVSKEIKIYTEEDHIKKTSEYFAELYQKFKNALLNLTDGIEIKPQKLYIAFKKGKNIVDIEIRKKSLKIFVNVKAGLLDDPKKITQDISQIGHWGNGDYQILVEDDNNLEYIMSLVKQAIYLNLEK